MKASTKAIRFLESLSIPEGPKAGDKVKLAPFQKQVVKGALADKVNVAVLSIGRGNAKTVLSAGIALGAVFGVWDRQPRREILIAARTRDQARIAYDFFLGFLRSLPEEDQEQFTIRPACVLRSSITATLVNTSSGSLRRTAKRLWDRPPSWSSWMSVVTGRRIRGRSRTRAVVRPGQAS